MIYKFGDFELNRKNRMLFFSGSVVPVSVRAFEILSVLIENQGRIVGKNELLEKVWTNSFVEENTLTVHVSALRKVLSRFDSRRKYIQTISGYGYTFVGDVGEVFNEADNPGSAKNFGLLNREKINNEEAYQCYLKGKYAADAAITHSDHRAGLNQALSWFERAVAAEPKFALAHAWSGNIHCSLYSELYGNFADTARRAKAAARKALESDENLPDAHLLQARIYYFFEKNLPAAEQACLRAIGLNPHFARAYHWLSLFYMVSGRTGEALETQRKSVRLDPASLLSNYGLARSLYFAGEYTQSITQVWETLKLDTRSPALYYLLALNYAELGLFNEALIQIESHDETDFNLEVMLGKAYILAEAGEREKSQRLLAKILSDDSQKYIDNSHIAYVHAALNDKDRAFEYLEKAFEQNDCDIFIIRVDPRYKNLRGDTRFDAIVKRLDTYKHDSPDTAS